MNIPELIQHKRNLIALYTQHLQALEARRVAGSYDAGVVSQMENLKAMILHLENEVEEPASESHARKAYALRSMPFPVQKYEDFVTRFAEQLAAWDGDASRYGQAVLASLKHACGARHAFIAQYVGRGWHVGAEDAEAQAEITALLTHISPFREMLLQVLNHNELNVGTLEPHGQTCLLLPLAEGERRGVLVIHDFQNSEAVTYDRALESILQTIVRRTDWLRSPLTAEHLELEIYNSLKRTFGYVSDAMYRRQFYLFNRHLESMTVFFEPIIFLNPTAPSIFGWEALARDEKTSKAPSDLFEAAELWGAKFLLHLDMYFLRQAVSRYVTDSSNLNGQHIRRKHTILPLAVNVHPASLIRTRYYDTIKRIEEQGQMPLNKLYLEISEKSPIPAVETLDEGQNVMDAFRESLYRFRDLDVHFSVDDFGVGFASSSRISRLGPAFVKIDRDALLDNFGNFTLEYVIRLTRRMPGEMRVIVEGYDDDSRFPLKKLYELGIRYVQGHKYGAARPQIDDRLPAVIVQDIRKALHDSKW